MRDRLRVEHDVAERARRLEPLHHAVVDARRPGSRRRAPDRRGASARPRRCAAATWSNDRWPSRGVDAVLRHVDVLRRRAHLAGVERQRERDVARDRLASRRAESTTIWLTPDFSVYTCACRAFSSSQLPFAALPVKSMMRTSGRSASFCATSSPASCATSVTTFGSKPASASTSRAICTVSASGRIAAGCGFTTTALPVARIGEEAGIAVPRRERAAADDEADAARHDPEVLLHAQRLVLALRLFPVRLGGNALHLVPRVGDGFEPAVLRVRPARLERHHERLAGRVHHGVGEEEARLVDPRRISRQTPTHASGPAFFHSSLRAADRGEQRVEIGLRIGDAERNAERRHLAADVADGAGLRQRKGLPRSASNAALPASAAPSP